MANYLKVELKFKEPDCDYIRRAAKAYDATPEEFVKTLFLDRFEEFTKELDDAKQRDDGTTKSKAD